MKEVKPRTLRETMASIDNHLYWVRILLAAAVMFLSVIAALIN